MVEKQAHLHHRHRGQPSVPLCVVESAAGGEAIDFVLAQSRRMSQMSLILRPLKRRYSLTSIMLSGLVLSVEGSIVCLSVVRLTDAAGSLSQDVDWFVGVFGLGWYLLRMFDSKGELLGEYTKMCVGFWVAYPQMYLKYCHRFLGLGSLCDLSRSKVHEDLYVLAL